MSDILIGIGIGIILAVVIIAIIIPDNWGIWLAKRRNTPKWLLPLCGIGIIAFAYFFVPAIKIMILQVQPWVWAILGISFVGAILGLIFHTYYKNHPETQI